jgi:D-glycero-alpha-D-manno-heptose-7-phosphate kinase
LIISRAPFRITLAGGGTDLPAFYEKHGSTFLSCAINKHIYVGVRERTLEKNVRVQYLDSEEVDTVKDLKHNRARACLQLHGFEDSIEVISSADLSARSGMGSSGSYIVSLLHALRTFKNLPVDPETIANEACHVEMEILKEPAGKQDQFIAAYGGITCFKIDTRGTVTSQKFCLDSETTDKLQKNCMIFYTGVLRNASDVLRNQQQNIRKNDNSMMAIQQIGFESIDALERGDLDKFGKLMHQHWLQKKSTSSSITLDSFDNLYQEIVESGLALGGKIIGAGGGGFLMLYVPEKHELVSDKIQKLGYPKMSWEVSDSGVQNCKW